MDKGGVRANCDIIYNVMLYHNTNIIIICLNIYPVYFLWIYISNISLLFFT